MERHGNNGGFKLAIVCLCLWLLGTVWTAARADESCAPVFDSGLQTHNAGTIRFSWGAQLSAVPSPRLSASFVDNSWGVRACDGMFCEASGEASGNLAGLVFPGISGQTDLTVADTHQIEKDQYRFRTIRVEADQSLRFNAAHKHYFIESLTLEQGASVTLTPGRYWIGRLQLAGNNQFVTEGGTVQMMVAGDLVIPTQTQINTTGMTLLPQFFQLFVKGNVTQEMLSQVNALVYVQGKYTGNYSSSLYGAVSAGGAALDSMAQIKTSLPAIETIGWNNDCRALADRDGDGILDLFDDDTDGDGYGDEEELLAGTDPYDASSYPGGGGTDPGGSTSCAALFERGLQVHGQNGIIDFGANAQLRNPSSIYLPAVEVRNNLLSTQRSCVTENCQAGHLAMAAPTLPTFLPTDDTYRQNVSLFANVTLDGSRSEWGMLNIAASARVRFAKPGSYRITHLKTASGVTLELSAGDYWIDTLELGANNKIQPLGEGTVRLHVRSSLNIAKQSWLNATGTEVPGDASKLAILAEGDITIANNATVSALIYAQGDFTVQYSSLVYGGVLARNVKLESGVRVQLQPAALEPVNFGGFCQSEGGSVPEPDVTPPSILVHGDETVVVYDDHVTVTGTVTDAESGVAGMTLVSDRFPGTVFTVAVAADGGWQTEVLLEEGSNQLTFTADDKEGNAASKTVVVERRLPSSVMTLTIDAPQADIVVRQPELTVRGAFSSELPLTHQRIEVNGAAAAVVMLEEGLSYTYSADIVLQEGPNTIQVDAWLNNEHLQRTVSLVYQPEQTVFAPPVIDNLTPVDGSQLMTREIRLQGRIFAEAGLSQLTINGQLQTFDGVTQLHELNEPISLPEGATHFTVVLVARDRLGQETQATLGWQLDGEAPRIMLDLPLQELPVKNRVEQAAYVLSGTVYEPHLESFRINGTDAGLEPADEADTYRFSTTLALPFAEEYPLSLEAIDQAGNRTYREYLLEFYVASTIALVLPTDGTELLNQGETISLQVAARIQDPAGGLTPFALLFNEVGEQQARAELTGNTTLKSVMLSVPPVSGRYQLVVVLENSSQQTVAEDTRYFTVLTPGEVPVELERTDPAENDRYAEPNGFISFYFNQTIDLGKLEIQVHETAHGKTYADLDELGTNELQAKGYQLVDVHRDYEAVPGNLSELPGSQVVAFYPERELAYDAEISVEVIYDGRSMTRMRYQTRPLPTLISGALIDQLYQPVPNIQVQLDELGMTSVTNQDGVFSFGFNESVEKNIPGGRYTFRFNPGQANVHYGSDSRAFSVQFGLSNNLGIVQLTQLNPSLPYVPLRSGQQVSLLGGELKLDLSNARVQFPDGREYGDAHVQVLQFPDYPYPLQPIVVPYWMYSFQPGGIEITGQLSVDLAALEMTDHQEYLPDNGEYVLIMGLNRSAGQILPVGVGRIENRRVVSVGDVHLETLDLVGFALIGEKVQPLLEAYGQGEVSIQDVITVIYQNRDNYSAETTQ